MKFSRKTINKILTFTAACCLGALILVTDNNSNGYYEQKARKLVVKVDDDNSTDISSHSSHDDDRRPPMFTFFEQADNGGAQKNEGVDLLNEWKKGWCDAGWDPIVLNMEHAKKHKMYKKFHALFVSNGINNEYEYYCFMRWLAVAYYVDGIQDDGVWMSDYDTFPLEITTDDGFNLPNDGMLTSYDGMAPALVSGSAREWNKIVTEMYDILYKKAVPNKFRMTFPGARRSVFFSDMITMDEIRKKGISQRKKIFQYTREVVGFPMKSATEVNCEKVRGSKAVHFSHHTCHGALKLGILPLPKFKKWIHRSSYVNDIMNLWKEQCSISKDDINDNSNETTISIS